VAIGLATAILANAMLTYYPKGKHRLSGSSHLPTVIVTEKYWVF
jgi:hypothetical protein